MKVLVKNLGPLPFVFELDADDGSVVRELLRPRGEAGDTVDIGTRVEPWELNRPQLVRRLVSPTGTTVTVTTTANGYICSTPSGQVQVEFQQEPDDLVFLFDGTGGGGGGDITLAKYKVEQLLVGTKNFSNTIFTTPSDFVLSTLAVYMNGVRLRSGAPCDFVASESGGLGTGYDTITLAAGLAPGPTDNLFADYIEP